MKIFTLRISTVLIWFILIFSREIPIFLLLMLILLQIDISLNFINQKILGTETFQQFLNLFSMFKVRLYGSKMNFMFCTFHLLWITVNFFTYCGELKNFVKIKHMKLKWNLFFVLKFLQKVSLFFVAHFGVWPDGAGTKEWTTFGV